MPHLAATLGPATPAPTRPSRRPAARRGVGSRRTDVLEPDTKPAYLECTLNKIVYGIAGDTSANCGRQPPQRSRQLGRTDLRTGSTELSRYTVVPILQHFHDLGETSARNGTRLAVGHLNPGQGVPFRRTIVDHHTDKVRRTGVSPGGLRTYRTLPRLATPLSNLGCDLTHLRITKAERRWTIARDPPLIIASEEQIPRFAHVRAGEPRGPQLAHNAITAATKLSSDRVRKRLLPLADELDARPSSDHRELARMARKVASTKA